MKTAFFVVGPEGSGTYMLAEAFVSAGCTYCDKEDVEGFLKTEQPERLVLRRSLPHAGKWPNITLLVSELINYDIRFFYILRDEVSTKYSVLARTQDFDLINSNYVRALQYIGSFFHQFGGRMISYEYFVLSDSYRESVFSDYGLKKPEMEFYDGNKKYYT